MNTNIFRFGGLAVSLLIGGFALPALGQEVGDAAAGRQIAEKWWVNGHVVARRQTRGVSNGARSAPPAVSVPSKKRPPV